MMAGSNRGSYFLPEVDDRCSSPSTMAIHQPYVLGAVEWSDTLPETNSDGKNNIRKIRSRSGLNPG
jgi:hypothetical protein